MKNFKLSTPSTSLLKAMSPGYDFQMVESIEADFRAVNKPRLLTTLIGASVNTHSQDAFIYDIVEKSAQLMSGKSYTQTGKELTKDGASQKSFIIPSFGGVYNVLASEWKGKRIPGTSDLMDEAYVSGRMADKVIDAVDLMNEIGIAQLITGDSNYIAGGGSTVYNYSSAIRGASRTVGGLDFASLDAKGFKQRMEEEVDKLEEKLAESGKTAAGYVLVCGKDVFNTVDGIETQIELPRALKSPLDLAVEEMPTTVAGNFSNFRAFESQSGVYVVKYSASILGTKLIADNKAYLLPVGVEDFLTIELAPAVTRDTVNTDAEAMYMWTSFDKRGVYVEAETNRLYFNKYPELIAEFTGTGF